VGPSQVAGTVSAARAPPMVAPTSPSMDHPLDRRRRMGTSDAGPGLGALALPAVRISRTVASAPAAELGGDPQTTAPGQLYPGDARPAHRSKGDQRLYG
jgi:hypothetical protein